MRAPPERSVERDAALLATLPYVATDGWTTRALRLGLREIGADAEDASVFPGGAIDMIETYCDLADRRMAEAAASEGIAELRLSQRVRALIALRLRQAAGEREAVRRAVSVLSLPGNALASARTAARTADAIWYAAGDRSADISWYSKRAILVGIYGATLLRWLADSSLDDADTLAFLDRRLAGLSRFGRLRGRIFGRKAA